MSPATIERADQRPHQRVACHQQPGHGAGEGEFAGAVHGEGHGAADDEGPDEPAADRHQERRLEGVLGEPELEEVADAHQRGSPGTGWWWAWLPGSVEGSCSALRTMKRSRTLSTSTGMP